MNVQLTSTLSPADCDILEKIYTGSVPEEERRPWSDICRPATPGCPRLLAFLADSRIAGLITLWRFPRFAYIEHLAIDNSLRGSGIGSLAIRCVIDEIGSLPLVVEIEPPVASQPQTVSRHKFYTRLGFSTIDTAYVQPPYAPGLPSVSLHLMATTVLPSASTARTLHTRVYGRAVSRRADFFKCR